MLGSLQNPSQLSKKQQKQEREWFAVSFKPENFIPGLVIGFIFGLFLDLSKPIKNNNNTTPKKAANLLLGKQQRLVSTNTDEELKMRFSTDFYITDSKSGIRALVKAGPDCKVIPLIIESRLVTTTRKCNTLSTHLRKWLRDRNLSAEARLLRLEEGYVKEGSVVSVIGMLHRSNDIVTIVQPPELISTGCLWKKLLLPIDVDGLIVGPPG